MNEETHDHVRLIVVSLIATVVISLALSVAVKGLHDDESSIMETEMWVWSSIHGPTYTTPAEVTVEFDDRGRFIGVDAQSIGTSSEAVCELDQETGNWSGRVAYDKQGSSWVFYSDCYSAIYFPLTHDSWWLNDAKHCIKARIENRNVEAETLFQGCNYGW